MRKSTPEKKGLVKRCALDHIIRMICRTCGHDLPEMEFYLRRSGPRTDPRPSRQKLYRRHTCRCCMIERTQAWRVARSEEKHDPI